MNVELFTFPTMQDGQTAVEYKYCELLNKYRNGEDLDPEALDWMDTANTWLTVAGSKL